MRKKASTYSEKISATLNMYTDDKIKSMPCVPNISTVTVLNRYVRVVSCNVMPKIAKISFTSSNASILSELDFFSFKIYGVSKTNLYQELVWKKVIEASLKCLTQNKFQGQNMFC